MKISGILPLATAAILAGTAPALAQNGANPPATLEQPTQAPHSSSTGTSPDGMGSTGWTGGSRGSTETTGQNSEKSDSESAQQQPEMATGSDLKGPPAQFPAAKTPE